MNWIAYHVPDFDPPHGKIAVEKALRDGIVLCKLISALSGKNVKFNTMKNAFKQMENIDMFLNAIKEYGVNEQDLFPVVDLYEGRNMDVVLRTIQALGQVANEKGQIGFGPKAV